jgi:predicted metal-dependent hydrolase
MESLKGLIAAHEMGHAMHMDHLKSFASDCGDIMFDTEAASPNRRAMSNYVPQPSGFSTNDQAMIRLWQQF